MSPMNRSSLTPPSASSPSTPFSDARHSREEKQGGSRREYEKDAGLLPDLDHQLKYFRENLQNTEVRSCLYDERKSSHEEAGKDLQYTWWTLCQFQEHSRDERKETTMDVWKRRKRGRLRRSDKGRYEADRTEKRRNHREKDTAEKVINPRKIAARPSRQESLFFRACPRRVRRRQSSSYTSLLS